MDEEYLRNLLARFQLTPGMNMDANQLFQRRIQVVAAATGQFGDFECGAVFKGTALSSGSHRDVLILYPINNPHTIGNIYDQLMNRLRKLRGAFRVDSKGVAIAIVYNNVRLDIIPAKTVSTDPDANYMVYNRKRNVPITTNLLQHAHEIRMSARTDEMRLLKHWRNLHELHFPSFYLELAVREALSGSDETNIVESYRKTLEYLSGAFVSADLRDPANPENIVSVELDTHQRVAIAAKALISFNLYDDHQRNI